MNSRFIKKLILVSLFVFGVQAAAQAQTKTAAPAMPETVMKLMQADKNLSSFVDLIEEAGLEKEFADTKKVITVFAPNNDGIKKIPSDLMKKARAEKDGLSKLVRYHTIEGTRVYSGSIRGRRAGPSSAIGETLSFDGLGSDLKVNDAKIITSDKSAGNGVVHIMNSGLVPELFKAPKKTETPDVEQTDRIRGEKARLSPEAPDAPAAAKVPEAPESPKAPTAVVPTPKVEKPKESKGFFKSLFGK